MAPADGEDTKVITGREAIIMARMTQEQVGNRIRDIEKHISDII